MLESISTSETTESRRSSQTDAPAPALADFLAETGAGSLTRAQAEHSKGERSVKIKQAAAEFTGTLAAGITGAVTWSLGTAATRGLGVAGTLMLAAGAGGVVKWGVKSALEHLLLTPGDRTAGAADLAWGAVDGLSGVAGSIAEKRVSETFLRSLGRKYLGTDISAKMAIHAGEKVVAQSLGAQIKHNALRGVVGGAAGSFTWSIPHSIQNNWELIKDNPASGLNAAKNQILSDTLTGTVLGAGFGGLGTVIIRSPQIVRQGLSRLDDAPVTRLDIAHINDLHSELLGAHGLPRIATRLEELRAKSAALGRNNHFYVAGDSESGNVVYAFSRGWLENESLARMKLNGIIPGNHPYDAPGGGYDVGKYVRAMLKVNEGRNLPLLAANLDLTAYPEYARMVRPYIVQEIKGASGLERVGVIGLITEEGAVSKIGYLDPLETAEKYIAELHGKGVNKIVVLSHLGINQDVELARKVKGISAIIGGHSHDFEPVPHWIRQGSGQGLVSRWFGWASDPYGRWDVPIVQAGSNGRWLGELNLAFKANGAADRFRTSGRLHPITNRIPADRELEKFIDGHLKALDELRSIRYNSEAVAPYSLRGIRSQETPLGNLITDGMMASLRKRLGHESVDVVLMNSGAIRAGIKANDPITRLDLANIFMNAGRLEQEGKDLYLLRMTGKQIKEALEYGVHDLAPPQGVKTEGLAQKLYSLIHDGLDYRVHDEPGSFLQVSGLRYSFDLSKPSRFAGQGSGGRVSEVMVTNRSGRYVPIEDNRVYNVATRLHAIGKWHDAGILGNYRSLKQTLESSGAVNLKLSQVDLLGEFIEGKTLDPGKVGRLDGRIVDLTPKSWQPTLRPGISLISYATMSPRALLRSQPSDDQQAERQAVERKDN